MPRGAQPKIAERESRMIYAAIKLFLENGYEQTTTVAIAQAAGMSSSAFFAVFANKEALLLKLTKWMYEKQFAITARLLGEGYEPEMFYAVEPSIQMYIAEKSEALRETLSARREELAALATNREAALRRAEDFRQMAADLSGDRAQKEETLQRYREEIGTAQAEKGPPSGSGASPAPPPG